MKGLELAEAYYETHGRPMLAECFGAHQDRIAAGLVGEGSQCLGFDDELSRDHDWGPGFCLWMTADDYAEFGEGLQARYDELPTDFAGYERSVEGPHAGRRTGVFEIKDFYRRFIRYDHVPASLAEWRSLPETYLATATNGKVFADPLGEFTVFRDGLLAFYPEDVRLKKLAARCAAAGQSGQYNYKRSVVRGELVAAHCALGSFMEAAISIVYLLNRRYRPFYKWMHRGVAALPILGAPCHRLLADLCAETGRDPAAGRAGAGAFEYRERIVEEISALIVAELTAEGLSGSRSDFLMDHAHEVQARIENEALRSLHVLSE
ncbi:MAG: DUF4037 domain-containing protein [Thermoleophilia bacterium]|nr:DUF4037 domain-containing protein [Thermoleophilia bacterium]